MEYHIKAIDIDDAKDVFLLAKDRLLDVSDWNTLSGNTEYKIALTNNKGQKVHRDARVFDKLQISTSNSSGISSDMWVQISQIQYDYFPDIDNECISMLLEMTFSPSGNGIDITEHTAVETILIKRNKEEVTAHCNGGNELPNIDDEVPDVHINTDAELHPVLSIPNVQLQNLLRGLISVDEYTPM
ncbi:MAG: hypothetical protein H6551_13225 [Chitinophagales bacterium]|nr:hypothetical protein [Chitinophagaceae bacterium]MCB9066094.1 hypothetical protein [Chitinophagales bacterium]